MVCTQGAHGDAKLVDATDQPDMPLVSQTSVVMTSVQTLDRPILACTRTRLWQMTKPCSCQSGVSQERETAALLCRYEPFVVAQTCVDVTFPTIGRISSSQEAEQRQGSAASGPDGSSKAGSIQINVGHRQSAYAALAAYAAGANSSQQKIAAGLPVLSANNGKVQLVLEQAMQVRLLLNCYNFLFHVLGGLTCTSSWHFPHCSYT